MSVLFSVLECQKSCCKSSWHQLKGKTVSRKLERRKNVKVQQGGIMWRTFWMRLQKDKCNCRQKKATLFRSLAHRKDPITLMIGWHHKDFLLSIKRVRSSQRILRKETWSEYFSFTMFNHCYHFRYMKYQEGRRLDSKKGRVLVASHLKTKTDLKNLRKEKKKVIGMFFQRCKTTDDE